MLSGHRNMTGLARAIIRLAARKRARRGGRFTLSAMLFGALLAAQAPGRGANEPPATLGERIYLDGTAGSGGPIQALDRSGQPVRGPQSHCVSCHRASGYGSNEGSVYVPPITGPLLFSAKTPERTRLLPGMFQQVQSAEFTSQLNGAHMRPAYDVATLARLLREGVDASGTPISPAMPRYEITDRDVAALATWLKTLSAHPDPGVDATTLRISVIVTDRTPPEIRKAVVDTARAFVGQINRGTIADRSRPNFSPYYRSDFVSFWRNWVLDVWELHGPEAGWGKQLADLYATTPVFAVASAAVPGSWERIGAFCDAKRLPCLFPLTDLPTPSAGKPGYTLFLSGGLDLEARAMAAYLTKSGKPARIVQLEGIGPYASLPASSLRNALTRNHVPLVSTSAPVDRDAARVDAIKGAAAAAGNDGTLVIWPGEAPTLVIEALRTANPAVGMVLLPSVAEAQARSLLTGQLAERVRIIHPTEMPDGYQPHSFRIRQWLNARGVAMNPPEAQYNVYYSLSVLEKAVTEIQGDFSRDYLIEHIETIAESNLNPGVYPTLSLGPGQRVASRGAYVVRLDAHATGGIRADGDWIVP
jgi:hypothetical protein